METEDENNGGKKGNRKGKEEQQAFFYSNIYVRTEQSIFINVTLNHYKKPPRKVLLSSKYRQGN